MSSFAAARCQHIKVSGTQCGSPALRSKNFCFYHQQNRPLTVECYSEQQCKFRPFPKVSKAKKGAENREVRAKSHALKTLSLTLRRSRLWQGMCAKLLIPIDRGKGGGVERRRVQNPAAEAQPCLSNRSPATKKKNTTEITPFIVKNAAFSLLRSSWRTSMCSYSKSTSATSSPSITT